MPSKTATNRWSRADWIKIVLWSLPQLALVLGSLWSISVKIERRLTTVETSGGHIIDRLKRLEDKIDRHNFTKGIPVNQNRNQATYEALIQHYNLPAAAARELVDGELSDDEMLHVCAAGSAARATIQAVLDSAADRRQREQRRAPGKRAARKSKSGSSGGAAEQPTESKPDATPGDPPYADILAMGENETMGENDSTPQAAPKS